jgi:hypothetical protein
MVIGEWALVFGLMVFPSFRREDGGIPKSDWRPAYDPAAFRTGQLPRPRDLYDQQRSACDTNRDVWIHRLRAQPYFAQACGECAQNTLEAETGSANAQASGAYTFTPELKHYVLVHVPTMRRLARTPDSSTAVFISAASPSDPQFRLIYKLPEAVMTGKSQIRMPGQAEWKSHLEWHGAKR